ncbi:MAG: Ig-like domain-containing protein, partial [Verrucomicrobiales bacterium]|nr:Ig-like domain-containing protein [Verrucomicrobiales bacterium]
MRKLFVPMASSLALTCIAYSLAAQVSAPPRLSSALAGTGNIELSWISAGGDFVLERTSSLRPPVSWQSLPQTPVRQEDRFSLTLVPAEGVQFYRLRQGASGGGTHVAETSPSDGESGVAVTRETILRFSAPLAPNTMLTSDRLFAEAGGRRILSRAELSGDLRTATLFYLENLPASARVVVTLDGDGLNDFSGAALDADDDGKAGGVFQSGFTTGGTIGLPGTAVIGHVFASEKNADGSNRPLRGAIVTVDGAEESLRTETDESGFFKLEPSPAGRFFVHVDGRTAVGSSWPIGAYYPFVGKAWQAAAGRTNNLAGGSGEIFLPLIQSDALRSVSTTEETKISFSQSVLANNPNLAGVEITVPPNALFSDNGVRGGKVGMAPVPADRLPEPLPPGLNFPLVITIQTDGGSNFDVPVAVKFPNLPDPVTGLKLGPGEKTVLWSFNHDTGRWEPQGTMTISADGQFAVTDPGIGVRQPGWHGTAPGSGPKGPGGGGPPGPNCPPYCGPRPDPPCNEPDPCGHLHFLYTEALEKWEQEAKFKESYSNPTVVALGKEVDKAYENYANCREANGRPCEGGAALASSPPSTMPHRAALASLPAEAATRNDTAIQNTIDEQNNSFSNTPLPRAGAWFAIESLETGFVQRGRLNGAGAVDNLVLATNERYRVSYYDALNRRSGSAYFRSAAAGQSSYIPFARLYGSEFGPRPDADSDGLSDAAELILATAVSKADSDGDGIKDGQEVFSGTNPLDGVGLPKGVVSVVPTPGAATDVAAGNNLAVVACQEGLLVVDLSDVQSPVRLAVVPGFAKAVALRGSLALVAFESDARLLDLAVPAMPQTLWSHTELGNADAVEFGRNSAFVVKGTTLQRLDLITGVAGGTVNLPTRGTSIRVRADLAYVLSLSNLAVCRDDELLGLIEVVSLPGDSIASRPRLSLGGDFLYGSRFNGINVFDLTDPTRP